MLHDDGVKVEAYDLGPKVDDYYCFKSSSPWFPVQEGSVEKLAGSKDKTLLMIWPCYDSPFAQQAIKAFEGDVVAYVGEGMGGCTGDDAFHDTLRDAWDETTHCCIPRWNGMHDALRVYRRK
jgi:hypothetical protein